jgi:serine/threonine-protein kinase
VADVVGSYRIIGKIGAGGMGAVYVAEHTLLGRQAAIKVLQREMSHRQDLVTRFFNEARAATAVKHPGIVEIYDFGYHTDGSAYIVMEYLEGETLASRLRRTGPLPAARAAALGRQVAGALGAAHARGIIHRDLKPDNIFIVRDPDIADGERTKMLDFGIAKLAAGDQSGISKTRTGEVMGTPAYMSPEQSKGAGNVDARTDLYSLGCILFEMVCGRPPFVAEGGGEVMAQHIFAPVPAPSSITPVTPQLEQFLLRALAKDPAHRFQSAEEMSAALQMAVPPGSLPHVNAPIQVPSRGPFAPVPTQQTTLSAANSAARIAPPSRKRVLIASVVAVVGLASGATAVAISQRVAGSATMAKVPEVASPVPKAHVPAPRPSTPSTPPQQPPIPPANPTPVTRTATRSAPATPPTPTPLTPAPTKAPAQVTIKLASEPRGADVYRMPQRVPIGTTPLTYSMDAIDGKKIVLVVKRLGYVDQQLAVPADRDTDQTVTLALVAAAKPHEPPPPGPGAGSASPGKPQSGTLDPFEKLTSNQENRDDTLEPYDSPGVPRDRLARDLGSRAARSRAGEATHPAGARFGARAL